MQRLRLGLLFEQIHARERQYFSLLKLWQSGSFSVLACFLFVEHSPPSGFFHYRPFYGEIGISGGQYSGGNVFHAFVRKGFQHTPGYQFIDRPFIFGKFIGQVFGND